MQLVSDDSDFDKKRLTRWEKTEVRCVMKRPETSGWCQRYRLANPCSGGICQTVKMATWIPMMPRHVLWASLRLM